MTRRRAARPAKRARASVAAGSAPPRRVAVMRRNELEALRAEVRARTRAASRWNASPEDVQRSVAQLVLSLVEFLRKLMERQAIRRMDAGTLDEAQIEAVGTALKKLEEAVRDMAARFGLSPDELTLDLGPLGRLH